MKKLTITQFSMQEIKSLIHEEVKKLVREEVEKVLASRNTTNSENKVEEKSTYSVEEAAGKLGLSKGFLRNEIRDGNLKTQRFGRRVLIRNEDFQNYLHSGSAR